MERGLEVIAKNIFTHLCVSEIFRPVYECLVLSKEYKLGGGEKVEMKKPLSFAFVCMLISIAALTSLSPWANASTQLLYKTPPYFGVEMGGGGTHYEFSADETNGNHRAYCYGQAWATAMVWAKWTHSGGTYSKVTINVNIVNGYENKILGGPFTSAIAKLRVKFVDLTTGTLLFDDYSTWDYMDGSFWKPYSFTRTNAIQNGHTYEVAAGAYVETDWGWWGTPSAEASGTVSVIQVLGDP